MSDPAIFLSRAEPDAPSQEARGAYLAIGDWAASGPPQYVAPLHVHYEDDEAWHVLSGELRFRFGEEEKVASAGSTVLVPAGVPHTFGHAGPEGARYLIIVSAKIQEMIDKLHATPRGDHRDIYRSYASDLCE